MDHFTNLIHNKIRWKAFRSKFLVVLFMGVRTAWHSQQRDTLGSKRGGFRTTLYESNDYVAQDSQAACVAAKVPEGRAASLTRAVEFKIDCGVGKDLFQAFFGSLVMR